MNDDNNNMLYVCYICVIHYSVNMRQISVHKPVFPVVLPVAVCVFINCIMSVCFEVCFET